MQDSNVMNFNKIIDESVDEFLIAVNRISENGPFRKSRKLQAAFSIFNTANEEFYEYVYFERTLEWFIRDILINQTLAKLFTLFKIECLWPEKKNEVRFSNESIENIYPFEFIVQKDGSRIGYRYTGLVDNEVDELIENYELASVTQIRWDDNTISNSRKIAYEVISSQVFFEKYFSKQVFKIFFLRVSEAVKVANDEIGFETIPRLSLRYLSNFKMEVQEKLKCTVYEDIRFQILPGAKDNKRLSSLVLSDDDYKVLNTNYKEKGLFCALLGEEGFAKCFITAEYQYQVFQQGNLFDYTSVVCGYLKSIEQLVYKLVKNSLSTITEKELWIKSNVSLKKMENKKVTCRPNPQTNRPQVVFKSETEKYFDITLTPLIWFLHDNVDGWLISDKGKNIVHDYLLYYASDCRNDHFHKDNIDEYEIAKCIRNNTILLVYLLLGGYKLSGDISDDYRMLGIADNSFDRLYKKIQELPRSISKFHIFFSDTRVLKAYRHFNQDKTEYDVNGTLGESKIRFVEVSDFGSEEYDKAMQGLYAEKEFLIFRGNMPCKICYEKYDGEFVEVKW